jgi:hypothetical protein
MALRLNRAITPSLSVLRRDRTCRSQWLDVPNQHSVARMTPLVPCVQRHTLDLQRLLCAPTVTERPNVPAQHQITRSPRATKPRTGRASALTKRSTARSLVNSREVLKCLLCDLTRQVFTTGHATASVHTALRQVAYVSVRQHWSDSSPVRPVTLLRQSPIFGKHDRTRRSLWGQRPVTSSNLLLPPFLHRVNPLQLQTLLLCKCANTTQCTLPCVCVLAFS